MMDVTSGGSADTAGVKEKDRLVEVNGENVEDVNHDQIVQKVQYVNSIDPCVSLIKTIFIYSTPQ